MTAAAALESGIIDPKTKINATGHWTYPGDPNSYANCWLYNSSGGRHGKINVSEALTVSCNYFFAEMGYQLGMERLNEYAAAFGLGEHTGIEISERTGARHENTPGEDQSPWAGFGQAQQVYTPLQLANYIATLLRGGQRLDAHLLRDVTSYDGGAVLYTHQPEILADLSLSEETLTAVKKGMGDLVTTGSLAGEFKNCTVTAGAKPAAPRWATWFLTAYSSASPPLRIRRSPWRWSSSRGAAARHWPPSPCRFSTTTLPPVIPAIQWCRKARCCHKGSKNTTARKASV